MDIDKKDVVVDMDVRVMILHKNDIAYTFQIHSRPGQQRSPLPTLNAIMKRLELKIQRSIVELPLRLTA